jgi:hypothetical protein
MKLIWEKQIWHYSLLSILLVGVLVMGLREGFLTGQFWGISTRLWFYLAIGTPVLHQVYVWFCWRTQLHYSLITRLFGRKGFVFYGVIFVILLVFRLASITGLALASSDSFPMNHILLYSLAFIIAIPIVYLLYSVARYFGFKRALGIDHFDQSYRHKPLVRRGIYRFTGNAMYLFGLMVLWIPGLLAASSPALLAALFSHIYIWVHYYTLEKPDMIRIYGPASH